VECRQALAALRLRARHLPAALPPGPWLGAGGAVCYDAVAAARAHPAYPTAACRLGLTAEDSLRYAPEFWPEFELNWVAVPRGGHGDGPADRTGGRGCGTSGCPRPWPERTTWCRRTR